MSSAIRLYWAVGLAFASFACGGQRAAAHPYIWINVTGELLYASDGTVTALSETWRFDEIYSAFAIQGLKSSGGHELSRNDLAPLLEDAVAALKENGAFTHLRTNGAEAVLGDPADTWFAFQDGVLALHFTLMLKSPVRARTLAIEIYDPTWFVDFEITAPQPLTLVGAPAGCELLIAEPNNSDQATAQQHSEAFFLSLAAASNFGEQFARRIAVTCP
jgi:ABC-type uncharacterized transport system substrate-binding protein